MARVRANLAAISTLRDIQRENRAATREEQTVLARWSGWGAVPDAVEERRNAHGELTESSARFAWAREELAGLLSPEELAAARRNTLNAHFTDASLAAAIWAGVGGLGFAGGDVLEPGCGAGAFVAFAPEKAHMVGVELDPITAGIASALYPRAQILNESFADTRAPEGGFDLVIGNVPFGQLRLTDRQHNQGGHVIHNHFLIKGLHLTRPGGLVVALTSYYTLDTTNDEARREMADLADLVAAVRLPSNAHRRAAGTKAVTDLVILRRREPDRPPADTAWMDTAFLDLPGGRLRVNEYFHTHPSMVLGEMFVGDGLYRQDELSVQGDDVDAITTSLTAALEEVAGAAATADLSYTPRAAKAVAATPVLPIALVGVKSDQQDGHIEADPDGTFSVVVEGQRVPHTVPTSQVRELRSLLGLRDGVVTMLEAEAATPADGPEENTEQLDALRADLNERYDAYLAAFGPINRFTLRRTGKVDPESGEQRMARIRPAQGGFRRDPHAMTVAALENFDSATQRAAKADIFRRRVVAPRGMLASADSTSDALAMCMDAYGRVELTEIARLLGTSEADARTALGTFVFEDPAENGALVPAAAYLSGNVRQKLVEAEFAAHRDPDTYRVNVDALRPVIPEDLGPELIEAQFGASWIPADHVEQFLQEILQDPELIVEHPGSTVWTVQGRQSGALATTTWGTDRVPAPAIAQATLEMRSIKVYNTEDKKQVLNAEATTAAQEKAAAMRARFAEWAWENPARTEELVRRYNDIFNAVRLRSYDDAYLSLPGMALSFTPRPHQVAAVARVLNEPSVLLAHEVGAGKTAEMAMAAMELRRLGMARKPAMVVPNHMLEQFGREFLQIYPQARVLVATKEELGDARQRQGFVARCATGNWDAVIISRSAFERIPMSREVQAAYMAEELAEIRAMIKRSDASERLTVKRLEAMYARAEERLKKRLDATKDTGVRFEDMGVDYLFVDEAHGYKNKYTVSNITGASIQGSMRASDLDMKLAWLREHHGHRVATFATATPISNTVSEMHVLLGYLRPDLLEAAGISAFDAWAATFGTVVDEVELSPEGQRFRINSRFSRFANVPELLRMFGQVADVKTAEDLKLPIPALAGGEARNNLIPASEELKEFVSY